MRTLYRWSGIGQLPGTITLAAFVLGGCASLPPVPVSVDEAGAAELAGKWAGEYSSGETGRSGSIDFELLAGGDSARGQVAMIPTGSGRPLIRYPSDPPGATPDWPHVEVLSIRFVRVSHGLIEGYLDPYMDPETHAMLVTTFYGMLEADRISGRFVTKVVATGERLIGEWSAIRKPD